MGLILTYDRPEILAHTRLLLNYLTCAVLEMQAHDAEEVRKAEVLHCLDKGEEGQNLLVKGWLLQVIDTEFLQALPP